MPFEDFVRTRITPGSGESYFGVQGRIVLPISLQDKTPFDYFAFYLGLDTLGGASMIEAGVAHKREQDTAPANRWHGFVTLRGREVWRGPLGEIRTDALLRLQALAPSGGQTPVRFFIDDAMKWTGGISHPRETLPKYVSGVYQATRHTTPDEEQYNAPDSIDFNEAQWVNVAYQLRTFPQPFVLWTSLNTQTSRPNNTHRGAVGQRLYSVTPAVGYPLPVHFLGGVLFSRRYPCKPLIPSRL